MNIKGKHLFYYNGKLEGIVKLNEEESRHCALSLRIKPGDTLFLTNGKGETAEAKCEKSDPKGVSVLITEVQFTENHNRVNLYIAPPKTSERLDWMIEKVSEIGVAKIFLLETQNSERSKINIERLNKIAVSAIKQSKQAYLPEIQGLIKFKQFIEGYSESYSLIAHISENPIPGLSGIDLNVNLHVNILIGPEGDFTREEVHMALNAGFKEVSLGKNILRTETAAVFALSYFNAFS